MMVFGFRSWRQGNGAVFTPSGGASETDETGNVSGKMARGPARYAEPLILGQTRFLSKTLSLKDISQPVSRVL
jgi:hypothetical protein